MEKMTPESLRDAIHQVAGEANAPHTPPHLIQERQELDEAVLTAKDVPKLLKSAALSHAGTAVKGVIGLLGTLEKFDKKHRLVSKQDFDAIQQASYKLDSVWRKLKKA